MSERLEEAKKVATVICNEDCVLLDRCCDFKQDARGKSCDNYTKLRGTISLIHQTQRETAKEILDEIEKDFEKEIDTLYILHIARFRWNDLKSRFLKES